MKNEKSRLEETYDYLRSKGIVHTQNEVADKMKANYRNFNSAFNGDEKYLTPRFLKRFNEAFGNIFNLEWLTEGKGEMLKSEIAISDQSDYPAKPFIDMAYAVCGKPNGFNQAIMERDCEKLHIPFATNYDFSIRAKGDSMINRQNPQRSIRPNDIIACKAIRSFDDVRMGELYALAYDGDIIIKKLAPSEKEGHVKCLSFNTEEGFLPFDVLINDVYGWAVVKCVASINLL